MVPLAALQSGWSRRKVFRRAAPSPLASDGRLKRGHESWSRRLQFSAMRKAECPQESLSAESNLQHYLAAILLAARTPDQAFGLQTVCQFNRTVMLNLQPFGQNADRCNLAGRQPLDRQQSLVLMRLDSCDARSRFAEIQEAADFVAEISEC